jgi:hypothetical protein
MVARGFAAARDTVMNIRLAHRDKTRPSPPVEERAFGMAGEPGQWLLFFATFLVPSRKTVQR